VPINVLITVPRLEVSGGVSNFYRVLRRHLDSGKTYFEIGSTPGESPLTSLLRLLGDYWSFHKRLSRGGFDVVHLNPSLLSKSILRESVFLLIARAHAIPVLVFYHGWDRGVLRVIERRFRWLFYRVYGYASALVVLAVRHRNDLNVLGIRAPIYVLTTLVEDAIFSEPLRAESACKRRVEILYLSRLDRNKGVLESVEAFALLRQAVPEARLTIAGDGPERVEAEGIARQRSLDGIRFLGHVEGETKTHAFLQSDIYLFPTRYGEGMPTTVLEAMAYGLPIVTRSVGGLVDFFENERMGFMTDSQDPSEFARLLERPAMDADLRGKMGAYNRCYAEEHFRASTIATKLGAIYARIGRRHDCSHT
jgi:glycosyltransferase involved in cell wall biosynthesis